MSSKMFVVRELLGRIEKGFINACSSVSGVISLVGGTSAEPHYAEVRDGQLLLYSGPSPRAPPVWRLPLRRLNLQPAASGRPRGFSLSRHGERTPIATFQVTGYLRNEEPFNKFTILDLLDKKRPCKTLFYPISHFFIILRH